MAFDKIKTAAGMETPEQTLARSQKFLNPEVSAKDLVSPAEPLKLPEPKLPMAPSAFVENLAPITKTADDAIVRVNSDEAKLQNRLLGDLTGRDPVSTRDVYQDTFDAEIERMTGVKAPEALRRLADENIKLAQLQGKFRTAAQKVSSAEGQSQVFEGVQLGELSREEAVQVGNQAILVQALQGNMSAARQTALDTAKFAYDDERMELDNLISQLDAVTGIVDQQRQDIVDAKKAEAEARKAELDRTRAAIDSAIMSGGATVAEMQRLTDLNVPDVEKQALAQQIVARTAGEDRSLDRANIYSQISQRGGGAGYGGLSVTPDGDKAITTEDGEVVALSDIDFGNPDHMDALPVSDLTKSVISGFAKPKDLTPTQKGEVSEELYKIGFNPNTYILKKLDTLVQDWSAVPEGSRGLVEGLKFWERHLDPNVAAFESNKTLLTREIARLFDVGVLSDQDVASYNNAMPSRQDGSLDVVLNKIAGVGGAATGQSADGVGERGVLEDGREFIVGPDGDTLLDPVTGKPLE